MELKPGYKKTEVGVIPEEWGLSSIGDRNPFITSGSRGWARYYSDRGAAFLRITNLKRQSIYVDLSDLKLVQLPPEDTEGVRTQLQDADLLISITADIGIVGYIDSKVPKPAYINQHIALVRFDQAHVNSKYLAYFLASEKPQQAFKSTTDQGAKAGMSLAGVRAIKAASPPLAEQKAIAAALSDADALIASLDRLIAKKRNLKQAAMQELLTGKRRLPGFTGEWEVTRLGETGTFSKGKGIRKDEVVSDGIPCVRYGDIYTYHNDYVKEFCSFISYQTAKESQLLCQGDLLFAGSGETAEEIGKCVAYLGDKDVYAGGDIVIFSPRDQNSMFLGYLMNHSTIVKQKSRMGQGDAVVHISARNLAQLEFKYPSLLEQAAIATILSDMDTEIASLEQRRNKSLMLKQGMMQELLTGRIRLV